MPHTRRMLHILVSSKNGLGREHRMIRLIEDNAKCRHLQNWTVKGLCGRFYHNFIDWIYCVHSVFLVFSSQLWDLFSPPVVPLPFSMVQLFPPPPLPERISILSSRIQCVRGGGGVLGLRQINNFCKVSFQVNFFRWRPFSLASMRLIFLRLGVCYRTSRKSIFSEI